METHQQRYLDHQASKREVLKGIIASRHSDRVFSDDVVACQMVDEIVSDMDKCPSSCDRRGVLVKVIRDRDEKSLLGGILVGGVGWIHRAPIILLYMASLEAYKAPGESEFMPFIDAGCMVMQCYLSCASIGLHTCYCNPNIRDMNSNHFYNIFASGQRGSLLFCGAQAIGYPP